MTIPQPGGQHLSDAELRAKLPAQEKDQPDPFLQMSTGRMGARGMTLFAVALVAIISIVLYGLNGSNSGGAAAPAAPSSAPAAAVSSPAPAPGPQQTAPRGAS